MKMKSFYATGACISPVRFIQYTTSFLFEMMNPTFQGCQSYRGGHIYPEDKLSELNILKRKERLN